MYQPLPTFPPILAPGYWWQIRIHALMEGESIADSIKTANRMSGCRSRTWLRYEIEGENEPICLSVPVAGGGSTLKNRHPSSWQLAPQALSAARKADVTLATTYGAYPWFRLIAPVLSLENLISSEPENHSAEQLCLKSDLKVLETIGLDTGTKIADIRAAVTAKSEVVKRFGAQAAENFNPRLSIADALFRHGPETIFCLLESF